MQRTFVCRNTLQIVKITNGKLIKPLLLSNNLPSYKECHTSSRISSKPYFIDSPPVKWTQESLITIHDFTGLPWWSAIIFSICGLRMALTFPLSLYQSYVLAKYENLKPEITALSKEIAQEMPIAIKKFNLNDRSANRLFKRSLKKQVSKLIIRDNCHPAKGIISMYIQIPIWVCVSLSLRNLSLLFNSENVYVQKAYTQLSTEGILWFQDLTMMDTTLALPIMLGVINLATLEIHALRNVGPPTRLKRWIKNIMRGVSITLIPISALMPSCVCLYWITSSSFGFAQNLVLQSPKIKRFFHIPKTESESSTPYKDLNREFKLKMSKLFHRD